MAVEESVADR